MSDTPRRIVVVDPSLRDNVGHHIEYDLSLIHGAANQGLEVVVLAHKDAATLLPKNDSIVPTFSEDMWGNLQSVVDPDIRRKVFLHRLMVAPVMLPLAAAMALARILWKLTGREAYRRLNRGLRLAGRVIRWFVPPIIVHGGRLLFQVGRDCCERLSGMRWISFLVLSNPRFYFELRKALRKIEVGEHDLIFCHMATHRHLLEWGLYATSLPSAPFARTVLLLRYPPDFYAPWMPHSQLAFRVLEQAFESGRLRMATDSERLANEFVDHTFVPFEIFPIPHTRAHALAIREDMPRRQKICFASLGNARAEKGIIEILEAVQLVHDKYDRREEIEFFLQLNDPDKECAAYVRSFLEKPLANVRFTQTALSSDEYQSILARVDVVLLPYWAEIYSSRTSGILLEAVAAGKPVIATANTWMTDELAENGTGVAIPSHSSEALAEAIIDIHRNFERYRALAVASAHACVRRHSPNSLIQQLLATKSPRSHPRRKALICYPWGGLFQRTTGAAVRTVHLIDRLKASGWQVAVLLPRSPTPQQYEGVDVYEHDNEVPSPFRSLKLALFIVLMKIGTLGRSRRGEVLLYMHRFWLRSRQFKLALNKCLVSSSALFLEYTFLADLVKPFARVRHVPLVVTSYDVLAMQIPDQSVRETLLQMEAKALSLADLAVSVSNQDQSTFRSFGVDTTVIPNSISINSLKRLPMDEAQRLLAGLEIRPGCPFVVFFGSGFPPNHQARDILKSIAPELERRMPGALIVVAGGCARPEDSVGSFRCLGVVSNDVKSALYQLCAAVVIPLLQGTGTSLKTIEAFAYGRPVVGTTVAFRGLEIEDRVHAVIQDNVSLLVEEIAEMLRRRDWATRLGEAARTFAMGYDFTTTFRPYIEFLESRLKSKDVA